MENLFFWKFHFQLTNCFYGKFLSSVGTALMLRSLKAWVMSDPVSSDFPHQINCKSRALISPLLPRIPCRTQAVPPWAQQYIDCSGSTHMVTDGMLEGLIF